MKVKLGILTVIVLLIIPQTTLGLELDEFKAEVDKFVGAFNSLDANAVSKMVLPDLTVFDTDSPFPHVYQSLDTIKNEMQDWFSGLESLNISLVNPQYKIIGDTGVVIGYETSVAKPKDGPSTTSHYRITMTFKKAMGKWLAFSIHLSYLPTGKP